LVSKKLAGVDTPDTVAVTVYDPAVVLAVKPTDATPCAFVVAGFPKTAKIPLGPFAGAAKVTVAPLTGLPLASLTVTCSAVAKAVLIAILCGVPAVAVTLAAGPA